MLAHHSGFLYTILEFFEINILWIAMHIFVLNLICSAFRLHGYRREKSFLSRKIFIIEFSLNIYADKKNKKKLKGMNSLKNYSHKIYVYSLTSTKVLM